MQNDVIAALPGSGVGAPDQDLLRNFLILRTVYNFTEGEDPSSFEALDSDTGAIPQALGYDGKIFWLDPNDSTSAHDGVTVIRTDDDYVYKVAANFDVKSVLSFTTTAPPGTPSLGDAYLVPAGATGSWSSHQDDIAVWTANGWKYEIPTIGRWLLDEEVGGFLGYTDTGWVYGPGARSFDDQSVPFSAAISWGYRFIVENQTTNAAPTATLGLCYIVGPVPTGAWSGHALDVAICEVAGVWTFYDPGNGWSAFDKSLNAEYRFTGSAWTSSAGTWVSFASVFTASGSDSFPSVSSTYLYSSSTAPTTSHRRRSDDVTLSHTARSAGTRNLRFTYAADIAWSIAATSNTGADACVALYRDSEANAIAWRRIVPTLSTLTAVQLPQHVNVQFVVDAPDASAHTYKVAITYFGPDTSNVGFPNALTRRLLAVEEKV